MRFFLFVVFLWAVVFLIYSLRTVNTVSDMEAPTGVGVFMFNGHRYYQFKNSVVHDPDCPCYGKEKEEK